VWVTAGYTLPVSSNTYLLLGIPLAAAFQLIVRRRPLRELFAAATTRFALTKLGSAIAAVLAIVPGCYAIEALTAHDWSTLGWYLAAMAGAVAVALRASSVLTMLRDAALPIAIGAGGMATVYAVLHTATGTPLPGDRDEPDQGPARCDGHGGDRELRATHLGPAHHCRAPGRCCVHWPEPTSRTRSGRPRFTLGVHRGRHAHVAAKPPQGCRTLVSLSSAMCSWLGERQDSDRSCLSSYCRFSSGWSPRQP
jgi:hypothetical protein